MSLNIIPGNWFSCSMPASDMEWLDTCSGSEIVRNTSIQSGNQPWFSCSGPASDTEWHRLDTDSGLRNTSIPSGNPLSVSSSGLQLGWHRVDTACGQRGVMSDGCGAIARDHKGDAIGAAARCSLGTSNYNMVKAVLLGLELANNLELDHIMVSTVSDRVCQILNGIVIPTSLECSSLEPLLDKIRVLRFHFKACRFVHTQRASNQAAEYVARLLKNDDAIKPEDFDKQLKQIIYEDAENRFYFVKEEDEPPQQCNVPLYDLEYRRASVNRPKGHLRLKLRRRKKSSVFSDLSITSFDDDDDDDNDGDDEDEDKDDEDEEKEDEPPHEDEDKVDELDNISWDDKDYFVEDNDDDDDDEDEDKDDEDDHEVDVHLLEDTIESEDSIASDEYPGLEDCYGDPHMYDASEDDFVDDEDENRKEPQWKFRQSTGKRMVRFKFRWPKPRSGWHRVDTNGCVRIRGGKMIGGGLGAIVRNHRGKAKAAAAMCTENTSLTVNQLEGVKLGLQLAMKKQLRRVLVTTNSYLVYELISDEQHHKLGGYKTKFEPILNEIDGLTSHFKGCIFQDTERASNQAAHYVSKLFKDAPLIEPAAFDVALEKIIAKDASGHFYDCYRETLAEEEGTDASGHFYDCYRETLAEEELTGGNCH